VANSRSARKRIRASERKHLRNRGVRSAVRTRITKARRALLGTEVETAPELVLAAVRELDRAAEKGILHRNNANRRKSRLMAMAHRLTAATQATGEDAAAARSAAAGGEKGRSGRAAKATTAKGGAKTATKSAAKASTRASADKPKTATRAKKG
jgi:small subunit ribosomal protein S20